MRTLCKNTYCPPQGDKANTNSSTFTYASRHARAWPRSAFWWPALSCFRCTCCSAPPLRPAPLHHLRDALPASCTETATGTSSSSSLNRTNSYSALSRAASTLQSSDGFLYAITFSLKLFENRLNIHNLLLHWYFVPQYSNSGARKVLMEQIKEAISFGT